MNAHNNAIYYSHMIWSGQVRSPRSDPPAVGQVYPPEGHNHIGYVLYFDEYDGAMEAPVESGMSIDDIDNGVYAYITSRCSGYKSHTGRMQLLLQNGAAMPMKTL